mgnify:CR=1 FL=1
MELYQAYTDYEGMMELTESLYRYLAEKVCGSAVITYNGIEIDLSKPFERITMIDAVKKYANIDFNEIKTDEEAKKLADEHHIEYEAHHKKGDIISLFFEEFCEDKLVQPTFVMDHPIEISPLTKKKPDNPELVERFELFINTWEMCNAYSELNDPIDQRERFAQQDKNAENADEEDVQVKAGADFGALLLNGLVDGIVLDAPNLPNNADAVAYSFGILQAARRRTTKTEYISCPSCGRTLYDLQHAVKEIKAATSHLKGLKIGIMGCIVNGPGEMADADYGYVGAAVGKVSLYKGKECVERNVPQDVALTHLIDLIKANGDWTEPKQQ